MIDISKLTEADKGRKVVYEVRIGQPGEAYYSKRDYGTIAGWNERFIFVRYGTTFGSQATRPEDLEFV